MSIWMVLPEGTDIMQLEPLIIKYGYWLIFFGVIVEGDTFLVVGVIERV